MRKRLYIVLLGLVLLALPGHSQEVAFIPLEATRLPSLKVPRSGHVMFYCGGQIVVAGGHTTGFVPTQTAEVFDGKEWKTLPTLYKHDFGFSLCLKDGSVLVGGGCEENIGVGQSYTVERYDPASGSFSPAPILDIKRMYAAASELQSGEIVVSGNWYAPDAMEALSPGSEVFSTVKDVSQGRHRPLMLRCAPDNLLVFSPLSTKGDSLSTIIIDRYNGDPSTVPLLDSWRPRASDSIEPEQAFIGSEDKNLYAYLLPVFDASGNLAVMKVQGEEFSLLPLAADIPSTGPYGSIHYSSDGFLADTSRGEAYLPGIGDDGRRYLLSLSYVNSPATVSVYYTTEALSPGGGFGRYLLLPEGGIMFTGGPVDSNFNLSSDVWLLNPHGKASAGGISAHTLGVITGALTALLMIAAAFFISKRKRTPSKEDNPAADSPDREDALISRILDLMENGEVFRRKGLTLESLSQELGTNTKYVSVCINSKAGASFTDFVNGYRIQYARKLLKENPGMRLADVSESSGFSSEGTFFRNFKAFTGMTPGEWISSL